MNGSCCVSWCNANFSADWHFYCCCCCCFCLTGLFFQGLLQARHSTIGLLKNLWRLYWYKIFWGQMPFLSSELPYQHHQSTEGMLIDISQMTSLDILKWSCTCSCQYELRIANWRCHIRNWCKMSLYSLIFMAEVGLFCLWMISCRAATRNDNKSPLMVTLCSVQCFLQWW